MQDYFHLKMEPDDIRAISSLGLAHIGDAVYELMVRGWLCLHGGATSRRLHTDTVSHVNAAAQAKAVERILPMLTEEEYAVWKRGRNTRPGNIPQRVERSQYQAATGLEALFGYLYLKGETDRLNTIFSAISSDFEKEV